MIGSVHGMLGQKKSSTQDVMEHTMTYITIYILSYKPQMFGTLFQSSCEIWNLVWIILDFLLL